MFTAVLLLSIGLITILALGFWTSVALLHWMD